MRPDALPKPDRGPLADAPFAALLTAAIHEGQAQGALRPGDPELLAQVAWAGVHGCLALPINLDRLAFAESSRLAAQMIDLVLADLTTTEPPGRV